MTGLVKIHSQGECNSSIEIHQREGIFYPLPRRFRQKLHLGVDRVGISQVLVVVVTVYFVKFYYKIILKLLLVAAVD